jgi:hypothetical protein
MSKQLPLFDLDESEDPTRVEVDIDYLQQTHVHICIPCYGGQLTDDAFISMVNWAQTCREMNISWSLDLISNDSLVTRARNNLVAKFLSTPKSTHLMFIDADIGWEPWQLLVLLEARKSVIGGIYPLKRFPIEFCLNVVPGTIQESETDLVEVLRTGTGFLLIERAVFEKLNAHSAVLAYTSDINYDAELAPYTKTYFDTVVRDNRYYSEDWSFCDNWRDLGGQVWIDRRILLKHKGSYTFDVQAQDRLHETLKRIYQPIEN